MDEFVDFFKRFNSNISRMDEFVDFFKRFNSNISRMDEFVDLRQRFIRYSSLNPYLNPKLEISPFASRVRREAARPPQRSLEMR